MHGHEQFSERVFPKENISLSISSRDTACRRYSMAAYCRRSCTTLVREWVRACRVRWFVFTCLIGEICMRRGGESLGKGACVPLEGKMPPLSAAAATTASCGARTSLIVPITGKVSFTTWLSTKLARILDACSFLNYKLKFTWSISCTDHFTFS
jgi:hypothetical protein